MQENHWAASRRLFVCEAAALIALALGAGPVEAGPLKSLYSFCAKAGCTDGGIPSSEPFIASAGTMYGTTVLGGPHGGGVIYRLRFDAATDKWKYTVLYGFCAKARCLDGIDPAGRLIADVNGNLYGTTVAGGRNEANGTVFELMPQGTGWTLKTLYRFCAKAGCRDGSQPSSGLTYRGAESGAPYDGLSPLYGETQRGGTADQGVVYSIQPAEGKRFWSEQVLHSFCTETEKCGLSDGSLPTGGLTLDENGNLFGASAGGGENFSGTIFELSPGEKGNWKERILYTFCPAGCTDGQSPTGIVRDGFGNLYGTTVGMGANGKGGTLFKLAADGGFTVLHNFCDEPDCKDGHQPGAPPLLDSAGNLYGTTVDKGGAPHRCGTAFRLSPNSAHTKWKETIVHAFSCKPFGDQATSALSYQGKQTGAPYDGVSPLYGTTASGGAGFGTVYELVPDGPTWKHKVVYAFCPDGIDGCTDGHAPSSNLIFDSSGALYGMTGVGGSTNNGVVYRLKPGAKSGGWRESILYNFCQLDDCTDGALPAGALTMDAQGRLFGTSNGPSDAGNIFELVPRQMTWREKTLHIFNTGNCDGYNPEAGLLLDPSGTFYGTTSIGGCSKEFGGTVFSLTGKKYNPIYTFCSLDHCADGDASLAPVIEDPSGNLYGTNVLFGANGNGGTVFELSP